MESNKKPLKYVNTLLDIERFSGESPVRLGPIMLYLAVAFGPVLIYAYYFLWAIPFTWAIAFFSIHIIRSSMVILGEERKRVEQFKQQLYDEYSSILEFMEIKNVHKDGLVEYKGNKVSYLIVTKNTGNFDVIQRAKQIAKILTNISGDYTIDIRCQNILETDELSNRYAGVAMFPDREAAKDYLEIIDFNRSIIKEDTLVSRVVFVVTSRKRQFKAMRKDLESALNSDDTRAFRTMIIADEELAYEIISRDIDAYIDFIDIQRRQYAKGEFFGSHVQEYDYETVSDKDTTKQVTEERGFMR